jgi:hypothetical protein
MDTKPMSEKQVKFIRDLFKEVGDHLPDEKKANLVRIMKAHLDGSDIKDTKWGSAAIDALKAVKTQINLAKAQEMRAKQTTKAVEVEEEFFFFFEGDEA